MPRTEVLTDADRRENVRNWPMGGRYETVDDWLLAGEKTIQRLWSTLIAKDRMHPETLSDIGEYSGLEHRPDIHPLVYVKPGTFERLRGSKKILMAYMGPSAGGKDTTLAMARARDGAILDTIVTHTTKPQRPEDVQGVTYHFIDTEQFSRMQEKRAFVESLPQYDRIYATSVAALEASLQSTKPISLWRGEFIGWNNISFWMDRWKERTGRSDVAALSVFILPEISVPTLFARILDKRLGEAIEKRLVKAVAEVIAGGSADICIVNPPDASGKPIAASEALEQLLVTLSERVSQEEVR